MLVLTCKKYGFALYCHNHTRIHICFVCYKQSTHAHLCVCLCVWVEHQVCNFPGARMLSCASVTPPAISFPWQSNQQGSAQPEPTLKVTSQTPPGGKRARDRSKWRSWMSRDRGVEEESLYITGVMEKNVHTVGLGPECRHMPLAPFPKPTEPPRCLLST